MSDNCPICGEKIVFDYSEKRYVCKGCGLKFKAAFTVQAFFDEINNYLVKKFKLDADNQYFHEVCNEAFASLLDEDLIIRFKKADEDYPGIYNCYVNFVDDFYVTVKKENGKDVYGGFFDYVVKAKSDFVQEIRLHKDKRDKSEDYGNQIEKMANIIRCLYKIAQYRGIGSKDFNCIGYAAEALEGKMDSMGKSNGLVKHCRRIEDYYNDANDLKEAQLFKDINLKYNLEFGNPRHWRNVERNLEVKLDELKYKYGEDNLICCKTERKIYENYIRAFNNLTDEEKFYLVDNVFLTDIENNYRIFKKYLKNNVRNIKKDVKDEACANLLYFFTEFAEVYKGVKDKKDEDFKYAQKHYMASLYHFIVCYYLMLTYINNNPQNRKDKEKQFKEYAFEYTKYYLKEKRPFNARSFSDEDMSSEDSEISEKHLTRWDKVQIYYKDVIGSDLLKDFNQN